jgi:hypothetical protein
VHPTPPPQQAWPISPHAPPWQPPPVHVPCACEQAVAGPAQVPVVPSQQPPPAHTLPSQQICAAAPQSAHFCECGSHA